jgi:hypothetical protein
MADGKGPWRLIKKNGATLPELRVRELGWVGRHQPLPTTRLRLSLLKMIADGEDPMVFN